MKGISTKKVFKVIGIVLASALGFVGAVIGVMAAMGKFKTPIVYPTVLEFAVTEQTIIETKTFNPKLKNPDGSIAWEGQFQDAQKAPQIYSFELNGTNPNSEHEVNKTSCYLWFENITGKDLIQT